MLENIRIEIKLLFIIIAFCIFSYCFINIQIIQEKGTYIGSVSSKNLDHFRYLGSNQLPKY